MQHFNTVVILYVNISLHSKVCDFLYSDGTWNWSFNSREFVVLFKQVQLIVVEVGREDRVP